MRIKTIPNRLFKIKDANEWFLRNKASLKSMNMKKDEISNLIISWLKPFKKDIKKMIEIGCGNGQRLDYISNNLNALGKGIEPSDKAISYAKRYFSHLEIRCEYSDKISFKGKDFDYIHLGFFLYLVDRSLFLKSISEIDRLLKFGGFISILDFDVPSPYSNKFSHNKNLFSHKLNNSQVFLSTGFYSLVNKVSFSHKRIYFDKEINERVSLCLLYKEKNVFKGC